jgi:hypothetical protein
MIVGNLYETINSNGKLLIVKCIDLGKDYFVAEVVYTEINHPKYEVGTISSGWTTSLFTPAISFVREEKLKELCI